MHLAADKLLWLPVLYCGSGQGRAQEINWLWDCYLFIIIVCLSALQQNTEVIENPAEPT